MCRLALIALCFAAADVLAVDIAFDRTPRDGDSQQLVIPRLDAAAAPVIDGDLSDPAWEKAAVIKSFWLGGADHPAEQQTVALVAFDADNLYVAYACEDQKVQTDLFQHDEKHIWMHDSVEVHLSPARDPGKVFQFILGPGGSKYDRDGSIEGFREQVAWNPPVEWEGASKVQPFGYTTEIRIPFAAVLDREKFDVDRGTWWKVKLTRLDFGDHDGCYLSSWTRMGEHTSDAFSLGDVHFESKNLLDNGSAERADEAGLPAGWEMPHNGMTLRASRSEADPTDGQYCAQVEIRGEHKGGINSRIYAGRAARHRSPAETTYRFSADVKAECEPGGLVSYFVVFNGDEVSQIKYEPNKGWQSVSALVTVEAGRNTHVPAVQSVPSNYMNKATAPGGVIFLDNVRFEPVQQAELSGDPDAVCLTGNAFGAQRTRNAAVAGTYTYCEPGTTGAQFPNYLRDQTPPEVLEYEGEIPFDKGLLTDGLTATGVNWAMFWVGPQGIDFVLDLKQDYLITRVVVLGRGVGYGQVFTKASADARYTLGAATHSLYDWDMATGKEQPDTEATYTIPAQPARWVRVQTRRKQFSPCEVQVWGKAYDGSTVQRKAYLQNDGKTPIAQPGSRPLVYKDIPPIFPWPQEVKLEGAAMALRDGMTIAWSASAGDRARVTAEVLAEELATCFGLKLKVVEGAAGDITLGEADAAPDKADGYALTIDGKQATIAGRDARGTFYGTQALLSLVRRGAADGWELPGAAVRDWPDMPVRFIQGRPIPDKGLIRALARFRVTHYEPQGRYHPQAAQWDKEAQRYFVQFVPSLDFNRVVLDRDMSLTERAPDETLESLGHGRRNANPAHPRTWEIYLAEVDKWLPQFHGDLVHINYDETYQTQGGARWNVSAESRALNLSAGDLIAYQVNRINDAFKKYGKSIVMHDTAFMSDHTLSYTGDPNPSWNAAMAKLPRDVKFLVWHPDTAGPRLHEAGFELYKLELDERDWRQQNYPSFYAGITAYMAESAFTPAKLINLVGVAWNLDAPRPRDPLANNVTACYIPVWQELHEGIAKPSRHALAGDFTPIDIRSAANRGRVDETPYDGKGFVDMGPNVDLRALPAGCVELAGVPFDVIDESANDGRSLVMIHNDGDANKVLPSDVTIDVADFRASSLVFLHCLEHRPGHNYLRRKELAGFYVMEYDDGTYGRCEIKYAVNSANWSGRPVNSGYNPRGHAMTDGFLAWEGDTTSGMPAFLYATEWVNPRPDKTIAKIHLRSTRRIGRMNPMLFAVTALDARLAASGADVPQMPSMQRLAEAQPVGEPLDLAGGVHESDTRYVAPDGTTITCPSINNLTADHIRWDVIEYRSRVGMVNAPGNFAQARTLTVDYVFPKPVDLAGALVTAGFRSERKTENFPPAIQDLTLLTSADGGKTWTEQAKAANVSPEEHGPQWLTCNAGPVTHLRIATKAVSSHTNGIEQVKIFRR